VKSDMQRERQLETEPSIYCLRLSRLLLEQITADLVRPHGLVKERVGFLFMRRAKAASPTALLLPVDYVPVADADYVRPNDPRVAAEITSDAICAVMQRVFSKTEGVLHVHLHAHRGIPHLSLVDRTSIPELVQAAQHAQPAQPHGALLLSETSVQAAIWQPRVQQLLPVQRISVVGYPMGLYRGVRDVW
jgi:hypothetical protein